MGNTISTNSFSAQAETEEDLIKILLEMGGYKHAGELATYIGVSATVLDNYPNITLTYLGDIIDANLTHLGYVMKDTKQEGMLGEYRDQVEIHKELNAQDSRPQPIIINDGIITEAGTLKISYIANAERIMRASNSI